MPNCHARLNHASKGQEHDAQVEGLQEPQAAGEPGGGQAWKG